ncbi:transposable element Tcb2 transposase [Trichonephila clavipes]|nr:transposable element Tcb2 transposase [Trichonephila clavipes]
MERSGDQYSEHLQSSESTRVSFRALGKRSKPQVQQLERLVVAARTTTAGDDRYIILQAKRGRRQSASVIAQQLSTATGRQVSQFTVASHLHKGGLFTRRPERCLPMKADHRRHRLQWCRVPRNWTTVNGVVSSLRMRVGSVPEAILNAF